MGRYIIEGPACLRGEVKIQGAKNAALPILAAALLCGECEIGNCPDLSDIHAARRILEYLGCRTDWEAGSLTVEGHQPIHCEIPHGLMSEMRSSIVFLGAIIARCGQARVSFPGGCELGPRPIDLHLSSLEKMGVEFREDHGYLDCMVKGTLHGAEISLPFPSVGATENIMLAGCTASGTTTIFNAAREPEIEDLAGFLNSCGGDISLRQDGTVIIKGVEKLHGTTYSVIPDRIAAATYLCCGAITGGELLLEGAEPSHLISVLPVLEEMGCTIIPYRRQIYLRADGRLKAFKNVRTMPYPGFPTDAQAPIMAVATVADGTSVLVENIFESRYKHVSEMARMGADIKTEGRTAIIRGVSGLHSATVKSTDLRGGASLVVCALNAQGRSEITHIEHILRGYERIDEVLNAVGAHITRIDEGKRS